MRKAYSFTLLHAVIGAFLASPWISSCSSPDNGGGDEDGDDTSGGTSGYGGALGGSAGTGNGGTNGGSAGASSGASGSAGDTAGSAGSTAGTGTGGATGGAAGSDTGGVAGSGVSGDGGVSGAGAGAAGAGGAGAGNGGSGPGGAGSGGSLTGGAGAGGAGTGGKGGTAGGGSGGAGAGGKGGTAGGGTGGQGGSAGAGAGGKGGTAGGGAGGKGGTGGAGAGGKGGTGGSGGGGTVVPLDCGGKGTAIENAGPPSNRVNYIIVGDGYSQAQLDTTLMTHVQNAMTKRFSDPIGQVYLRYRKFVNICVLKIPSTPICGSSVFDCCGDDSSRLASCNSTAVNNAISQNMPSSFEVDWRAVVLNGSSWWNTGSSLMLWSGGNQDAPGAALHEGGHGFHQLADEYCAGGTGAGCGANMCGATGTEYNEVNSTGNCTTTNGKWDLWLGYNQVGGTGLQGTFVGSRYVNTGQYRPSSNSMMNSLFGNNVNTSFNSPSREKMIMDIWRIVLPYDSVSPPAGAVTNPSTLTVNVIDPAVISVDWAIDGSTVAANGGPTLDVASRNLTPGSHAITARAYDNAGMDLVRNTTGTTFNRQYWGAPPAKSQGRSDRTVTWTVTIN